MEADWALCGHGDMQLVPTYMKHCVTVDTLKSMSTAHQQKASDACFWPTIAVPSLISTDATVMVATIPGAGNKPNERHWQRNEPAHKIVKAVWFDHCKSDSDYDFM